MNETPPHDTGPDAGDATGSTLDTKERLLDAGMHVFAERGYADAGIREICARAGANPAAVNYHFGDKKRFYAEVLASSHERAAKKRPMPRLVDPAADPEETLRQWIRWFMTLLLHEGSGPLGRLMNREMADPTEALDVLVRRSIQPMHTELGRIVAAIVPAADEQAVDLLTRSILGQCVFYKHSQQAMERLRTLVPESDARPFMAPPAGLELEAIVRHVGNFSVAGLRAWRSEPISSTDATQRGHAQ